jgi:putative transposase
MAEHQDTWPVTVLCEVWEVSRSGFYAYLRRQGPAGKAGDELVLIAQVKAIAAKTRHSYGSRRMAKQLQAEGFAVGRAKARRWMHTAGVMVRRPTHHRPMTPDSRHGYGVAPNLLARQFDVGTSDQVWVGDITYLWTQEGWLYLSVLLDLSARKGVGWAMSSHIDAALVQEALRMAVGRRQPTAGLLHHADRGSQYACHAYQRLLDEAGRRWSMSRKGDCLDHAVAERFFGSLKRERTAHCSYATRQDARDDVIDYIEMFYNSTRLHSYLGYRSPNDYEAVLKVASPRVRFSLTTTNTRLRTCDVWSFVVLSPRMARRV